MAPIHTGDLKGAQRDIGQIEQAHKDLLEEKKEDIASVIAQDSRVARAWLDHAQGNNEEALRVLRAIAEHDEGMFEAEGELPAHEMLGDMLVEMDRPQQAVAEYDTELTLSPNRFDSLYGAGRAAEMAKQPGKAAGYYRQLLNACAGEHSSRAEIAHAQEFLSTTAKKN